MKNQYSPAGIYLFGILFLILAGVLGWANYQFVGKFPESKNFLIQWTAFRVFAREGLSPYSEQAEQETERVFYGHLAQGSEEKLIYTQPFYAGIFMLPFAMIADYHLARALWLVSMQVVLFIIVLLSLRVTDYRPKSWVLGLLLIFTIFGYPAVRALLSGSLVIIAALWIVLAFMAMRSGRLEVAGLLFALATVYPKSMLLLGILLVVWSWSKRNWSIVFWYAVGILFLSIVGFFLLQDWPIQYLRLLWQMRDSTNLLTAGKVFTYWMPGPGRQFGWGLTAIVVLILSLEWWSARRKEFRWLFWTGCLTMVVSLWIGFPVDLEDQVLLILPLILFLSIWEERYGKQGHWMAIVAPLVLLLGLWFLRIQANSALYPGQAEDSLLFPMPLLLLFGLYWVRWWAIRPAKTFIEDLRSSHAL